MAMMAAPPGPKICCEHRGGNAIFGSVLNAARQNRGAVRVAVQRQNGKVDEIRQHVKQR